MVYGDKIEDTRQLFFLSWKKYRNKQTLLPLEEQIAQVIFDHPEYHEILDNPANQHKTYFPELGEENPFLHLGLHLTIRDQVALNRPIGITGIYQGLLNSHSKLEVEHLLMERLAECLWSAQRNLALPDETAYLYACQRILKMT